MIQIKENKIIMYELPNTGEIDGRSVSNYNYLDAATLYSEGWYDEENIIPEYNPEIEYPELDYFEIDGTKVKVFYKIVKLV